MNRGSYRADIDGLRAIAVLLVVAFHFGVPGVTGGYIGVDLFFVISGFLIATIFDREPEMSLARLASFYGRRIQRLAPAFLFVAVATIAVASVLLLPDDYQALLNSIRESLTLRSHLYFERETTGYFAANAADMPWLHTWSLSVEWQFYLVYPSTALLLRLLPSRTTRSVALCVLVAGGVALSIGMVAVEPTHAYFSPAARFFEFLTGALAASISTPDAVARRSDVLVCLCLAGIVALAMTLTAATPFPGVAALAVCVVGFGLLVCGRDGSILSNRRLAAFGMRSYSIYLWHWPVIALLNYVQHRPSAPEAALWFVAICAASEVTYRWIERPGIDLRWRPRSALMIFGVLPFAVTAMFYVTVRNHAGYPDRLGPEARHAYANLTRYATVDADRCHDFAGADIERCAFGDLGATTTALMIGDSHARHFRPFVQVFADDAHVKVYGLTSSVCLTLEGTGGSSTGQRRSSCANAVARDFALIRHGGFRYVILAERWIGYTSEQLSGLDGSIALIVASGAIPVVFESAAEDGTDTKDCFYRHIKLRSAQVDDCAIVADNDFAKPVKAAVADLMQRMRRKYPSLILIDPQAVQCRDGECITVYDATPIYTDAHHLNPFGAIELGRRYRERFGNPLASKP